MPLPIPKPRERQGDFVNRCMIDPVAKREFPDSTQRAAVCFSQLRRAKQSRFVRGLAKGVMDNALKEVAKAALLNSEGDKTSSPIDKLIEDIGKAALSTATVNDLPDSAFAVIMSGGEKDESGRTVPRALRKFPIHDAAHVRNALARLNQATLSPEQRRAAFRKISGAAARFGIKISDETRRRFS